MKTLLLVVIASMSLNTLADSTIRVVNLSEWPVTAIWQALGCVGVVDDPEFDVQWTVCHDEQIEAGQEVIHSFSWWNSDRSVKVWGNNYDPRIGYCNSMDNETLIIRGTTQNNQEASGC